MGQSLMQQYTAGEHTTTAHGQVSIDPIVDHDNMINTLRHTIPPDDVDLFKRLQYRRIVYNVTGVFQLARERSGPTLEAVYARTTINLDNGAIYEDFRILRGLPATALANTLPFDTNTKFCKLNTILLYGTALASMHDTRLIDGRAVRNWKCTTHPGVWPYMWFIVTNAEQHTLIQEHQHTDNPDPRLARAGAV